MYGSRSDRIRAKVLAEAPFGARDKSGARWPVLRSKLDSDPSRKYADRQTHLPAMLSVTATLRRVGRTKGAKLCYALVSTAMIF